MLEKENMTLDHFENSTFAQPWLGDGFSEVAPELCCHIGSGSGGYADHIFKYAAFELFGIAVNKIDYKQLRYIHQYLHFASKKLYTMILEIQILKKRFWNKMEKYY